MSSTHFQIEEHLVPCQHIRQYPRATALSHEDELQLVVKQYTPLINTTPKPGDVTIIAAHACGFGKELYEPIWDDLLLASQKTNAFRIRSIWFADVAHQGASGLRNEDLLGNDPSWFDHSRDLLQMINRFRKDMITPLVGFGHSMGGNQLVHLALIHPRLFHTLILVDPIIQPRPNSFGRNMFVAYLSTFKQDSWKSRKEAEESIRGSAFYQAWDSRVLDLYLKYGLRLLKDDTQAVGLTTSKHQEVFSIARPAYPTDLSQPLSDFAPTRSSHPDLLPYATNNTYRKPVPFYRPESSFLVSQLPTLRPSVLCITPTSSTVATPAARAEILGAIGTGQGGSGGIDEGAVREVVMPDSDHFVTFSKPGHVAAHTSEWLSEQLQSWFQEAEQWKQWASSPAKDKRTTDKAWKTWMRRQYGNKKQHAGGTRLKSKI